MKNESFLTKIGFTPCFDVISRIYPKNVDRVLGKIWRFSQMGDGVCNAAIGRMAKELGISYSTVERAISILLSEKLIEDLTPGLRNHPHTYRVNEDAIVELENTPLIQNELVLGQNELPAHSNLPSGSFKMTDEETESFKKQFKRNKEENSKTETSEGKPPSSSLVDNSSSLKEDKDNPVSSIFKEEYDSGLLSKEEDKSSSNPSRIDTQDVDTSLVSIEDDKNFREVIKMNTKQGVFKFYRDDPNFDNYLVLGCKVELEPVAIGV